MYGANVFIYFVYCTLIRTIIRKSDVFRMKRQRESVLELRQIKDKTSLKLLFQDRPFFPPFKKITNVWRHLPDDSANLIALFSCNPGVRGSENPRIIINAKAYIFHAFYNIKMAFRTLKDNNLHFRFHENEYGVSNPLEEGWNSARMQLAPKHPLEVPLRNFKSDQIKLNNSVLLHAQGPAGPLIQAMEFRAVNQVGRHPFLQSSNFQVDVLTGKDMEIDFDDFLNPEEYKEIQAHPHMIMENLPLKSFF